MIYTFCSPNILQGKEHDIATPGGVVPFQRGRESLVRVEYGLTSCIQKFVIIQAPLRTKLPVYKSVSLYKPLVDQPSCSPHYVSVSTVLIGIRVSTV